jgi:hypothetical protein
MQPLTPTPNMRRADAARYLREVHGIPCAPATLAKDATVGGGPVFRKASGKFPIYAREDLDAWANSRLSKPVRSTSELIHRDA